MTYINFLSCFLIKKYDKNELITERELECIITYLIDEFKLGCYISHISIQNSLNTIWLAAFDYSDKLIKINYGKIVSTFRKQETKYTSLMTNINMLNAIFHELKHAMQYKLISENSDINTIEKEILYIELTKRRNLIEDNISNLSETNTFREYIPSIIKIRKLRKLYKREYPNFVSERQAECFSKDICSKILEIINNSDSLKIKESFRREKTKILLNGYRESLLKVKYPSEYYKKNNKLLEIDGEIITKLKEISKDFTLEEKMIYGVPITKKEFREKEDESHIQLYPNPPICIKRYKNMKK